MQPTLLSGNIAMPRLLHAHPNGPIFLPWRHNIKTKGTLPRVQGSSLPMSHSLATSFLLQGRRILRPSLSFWGTPSYHSTKLFPGKIMCRGRQVDTMVLPFPISPTIRLLNGIWRKVKKSFQMCFRKWTLIRRKQRLHPASVPLSNKARRILLITPMQPLVRPYQLLPSRP